jgi:hypothetical protein
VRNRQERIELDRDLEFIGRLGELLIVKQCLAEPVMGKR